MCRAFSPWRYGGEPNLGLAAQAGMCQAFGLGKFSRHPSLIAPNKRIQLEYDWKTWILSGKNRS